MLNLPNGAPKQAFIGPRITKPEGSVDWCWQTLDYLKYLWRARNENIQTFKERIEREIKGLEEHDAGAKIPPDHPYGDLDALLKSELGVTREELSQTLRLELLTQARAQEAKPNPANGYHPTSDNCKTLEHGNSADYLTARIARDRPDILEEMKQGKYRSVRQAAIDAGIVKPQTRYSLPDEPKQAGRYLAQRVDKDWMMDMFDEYMKAIGE